MKYLMIVMMMLMSVSSFSSEQPAYLKDGVITVTLKSGKTYTFSANEYMIVKRESKAKKAQESSSSSKVAKSEEPKRLKHIVSGEVVRSNGGLETSTSSNSVDVRNKKEIGLGLQYQYNFYKDLYMGGRVDSNGGAGVNLGVGF